jgi:hypothetical protein
LPRRSPADRNDKSPPALADPNSHPRARAGERLHIRVRHAFDPASCASVHSYASRRVDRRRWPFCAESSDRRTRRNRPFGISAAEFSPSAKIDRRRGLGLRAPEKAFGMNIRGMNKGLSEPLSAQPLPSSIQNGGARIKQH